MFSAAAYSMDYDKLCKQLKIGPETKNCANKMVQWIIDYFSVETLSYLQVFICMRLLFMRQKILTKCSMDILYYILINVLALMGRRSMYIYV